MYQGKPQQKNVRLVTWLWKTYPPLQYVSTEVSICFHLTFSASTPHTWNDTMSIIRLVCSFKSEACLWHRCNDCTVSNIEPKFSNPDGDWCAFFRMLPLWHRTCALNPMITQEAVVLPGSNRSIKRFTPSTKRPKLWQHISLTNSRG
jgi:hypothetical protein